MSEKKVTRRGFLKGFAVAAGGAMLAGCAPQVVKETVVVEKVVSEVVKETVVVEGTPQVVEKVVEKIVTATPEPETVYIWSYWTPPRDAALQISLDEFHNQHPGITAVHELLPSSGAAEKILTSIAGGQPPDILMLGSASIPQYVDQGALVRVDKYMTRDGLDASAWFPADVGPTFYRNMQWALPCVGSGTRPIYYNFEHFEKAGLDPTDYPPATSWEDLEELASQLNIVEGGEIQQMGFYPVCRGGYYPRETTWYFFSIFNGGREVSEDFMTATFDENYREGMQWVLDFTDKYCGGYEAAQAFMEFARGGGQDYNAPFYTQKESMSISGPWEFTMIPDLAPDVRFDLFQVPYGPSYTEGFVTEYGGLWTWCIPNGVENPDASWEALRWLTYDEGCGLFTRNMLRPPALISEAQNSFWAENIPVFPHYVEALSQMPIAEPKPAFPGWKSLTHDAFQQVLLHQKTVDEAADWAAEEGQLIIDEYWAKQA